MVPQEFLGESCKEDYLSSAGRRLEEALRASSLCNVELRRKLE